MGGRKDRSRMGRRGGLVDVRTRNKSQGMKRKKKRADVPRFVSISITSSRVTCPSLSLSKISNVSLSSRILAVGSLSRGSWLSGTCFSELVKTSLSAEAPLLVEVREGEAGTSRRGVKLGRGFDQLEVFERGEAVAFASLVGDAIGVKGLAGELRGCLVGEVGVVGWRTVDGDAGDSGRRKGEVLGEPYESGEGL